MTQYDNGSIYQSREFQQELGVQRTFMARVYCWMTIGMLVTALTALAVASDRALALEIYGTGLYWVLFIAEIGLIFGLSRGINRLSYPVAAAMFVLFSAVMGASLAFVLVIFTAGSVAGTFFITAGMFGAMSVYGYVTKRDLTSLGHFLMMGLIGLLLAIVVNWFLASPALDWLISFIGVIVFTGLTAYDTQKIKQSYAIGGEGTAIYHKTALMGALSLYLDFINLFIFLLQFTGSQRN